MSVFVSCPTGVCVDSGRIALELHSGFLRMVGKSNEFKVLYKNIARMYYLPRPSTVKNDDPVRYCFVISLEEPLRQGQQRYQHLVMQLEVRDVEIPVNLSEVSAWSSAYSGTAHAGVSLSALYVFVTVAGVCM